MDQSDGLVAAVEDLTTVATELREVRKRSEQYGQATTRLQEVSNALGHLVKAVSGMHTHYQELIARGDTVIARMDQARLATDATLNRVPEVVSRIENSDVSKNVGEFSRALAAVSDRIAGQLSTLERIQTVLAEERDIQMRMLEDIAARTERITGAMERIGHDVTFLRGAAESQGGQVEPLLNEVKIGRAASDKAANAAAVYGHKALQVLSELSSKVETMQASLDAQSNELAAIKRKKGIVF